MEEIAEDRESRLHLIYVLSFCCAHVLPSIMLDYFSHIFSHLLFPYTIPLPSHLCYNPFLSLAFSLCPPTPTLLLSVAPQQDTSMVWVTVPTPSVLSECVQAREREPSVELALVREAVLERARRVILAEGM